MTRFQLLVLAICEMATMILGCEPQSRETEGSIPAPVGSVHVVARVPVWSDDDRWPLFVIRDDGRGVTCYTRSVDSIFCVPDAVRPTEEVDAGGR